MRITQAETLTRNWGDEIIVAFTPTHAGKILRRKAGTKGGFQCHLKEESHYLMSGRLILRTRIDGGIIEQIAEEGACWTVPPLTVHQEETLTDCVVFEVSDPTREDRYAIEPDPGGLPSLTWSGAGALLARLSEQLRHRADECDDIRTQIDKFGLAGLVEG